MWQKQQAKKPIRHWEKGENTFMCETWSDVHNRFQFIILKKADFYYLTENTFFTSQKANLMCQFEANVMFHLLDGFWNDIWELFTLLLLYNDGQENQTGLGQKLEENFWKTH